MPSGHSMKTCQPATMRSRALATAVSALSRTAVVASSLLVPRTMKVISKRPFRSPKASKFRASGCVVDYDCGLMTRKLNRWSYYVMAIREVGLSAFFARWADCAMRQMGVGLALLPCARLGRHWARMHRLLKGPLLTAPRVPSAGELVPPLRLCNPFTSISVV